MNVQQLMKQAQAMQKNLENAKKQHNEKVFEGVSGGGLVRASLTGSLSLHKISIDPSLLNEEEKETVEDLIIVAVNNAMNTANNEWNVRTKELGIPSDIAGFAG
ncbi:MAG: YbaB/EbfC family nucleoid-associated protein [Proteobacteria bacterium]|nr:YbaB/EbfC family nucleoid-associated protein [Pseudomonadota bacterium]